MKRTSTVAVAAGLLSLGTFLPMSFAASETQFTAKIDVNGQQISAPTAIAAYDGQTKTTYIPIYYVDQALKAAGFVASWDGTSQTWSLLSSAGVGAGIAVGSGNANIDVNGKLVKKINTLVAHDPSAGSNAQETVYMPIYYVDEIIKSFGSPLTWNGKTWNIGNYGGVFQIEGATSMKSGASEQLALTATKGGTITVPAQDVNWTVKGQGQASVDDEGNFSSSTPGVYTVTATYGNNDATTQIEVYGQPAQVIVGFTNTTKNSDGTLNNTIQVRVCDDTALDNTVSDFNGTVQLALSPDSGTFANGGIVDIQNGVGTITLTSPQTLPSGTETITSSNLLSSDGTALTNINYGSIQFSYTALAQYLG
ncbi:hypothetical protein [Alicyclobacillus fodiniaquatilis]|uniref:Copper amine oxidase N-terminal domain-containing protein n=1 Tax=Alicyclobacillus fodiniaquatilis TaxID=1661150 RepID=A0ABW4JHT5_9BACL